MATKFCKDCGDYRPVSDFSKNARSRDGLAFYCREHLAERSLRSREARRIKPRVRREPPTGLVVPVGQKWCPDCGEVLPLPQFVRTVQTKSGYSAYCKPCHNARSRASREKVGGSRSYTSPADMESRRLRLITGWTVKAACARYARQLRLSTSITTM